MSELYCRVMKVKSNPLLGRKQFMVDVLHPKKQAPSKKQLREKLAKGHKVANPDLVILYGFKTAFGGGRSRGFALIYNSVEDLKKFEANFRLLRQGMGTKKEGINRKGKKDLKNRQKKVRGIAKAKLATAGKK
eukprot:Platyproteum_vivax@DN763_c0_g1_i1.p1